MIPEQIISFKKYQRRVFTGIFTPDGKDFVVATQGKHSDLVGLLESITKRHTIHGELWATYMEELLGCPRLRK